MSDHYARTALAIGQLVDEKNAAYGSAFARSGAIFRVLFPDGIPPHMFEDALAMVRVVDKLFRIANRKDAFGEDPWQDIAGYGVLMSGRPPPAPPETVDVEDELARWPDPPYTQQG